MFFRMVAFFVVTCFPAVPGAVAITFTNLYVFSADTFQGSQSVNGDGVGPVSLVLSGKTLYGTALAGGTYGYGTIFRIDTDGTHFTNLFNFNLGTYDPGTSTYPDSTGDTPNPGLLLVSNTLYGTTFYGGVHDAGSVFKINTDGSGFATLFSFAFTNGQQPASGLTLYNNTLYGTTAGGGTNQSGTLFSLSLPGYGFTDLHDFTNNEEPYGGVVVSSNLVYGFCRYGGPSLNGLVYRVGTGGDGFVHLLDFDGVNGWGSYGTPVLSGNTLFGVTYQGGTNGSGNVFRLDTDGSHYTNLFTFQAQGGANITGAYPYDMSGLVLSGDNLYGTASVGGTGGQGTVFALKTDGTGFNVFHSFQYSDGSQPHPLVLAAGTLYGATTYGFRGSSLGVGGIFALVLQPTLNLAWNNNHAVLSWNDPSFFLYHAASVAGNFTKIVGATTPYTNPVASSPEFFRLQSN
jgi:uncharacterized repeat protein (TIGR03803 family)